MSEVGWFADIDGTQTGIYKWQPVIQCGQSMCCSMAIWFETEHECEQWIAEYLIGAVWLDGEPTAPPELLPDPSAPAERRWIF